MARWTKYRLNGNSIFFAIFLLLVSSILLSGAFLVLEVQNYSYKSLYQRSSILGLLRAQCINSIESSALETEKDWGLFKVVTRDSVGYSKSALVGRKARAISSTAVFIDNKYQTISARGKCEFQGDFKVPRNRIESDFNGKVSFQPEIEAPRVENKGNLNREIVSEESLHPNDSLHVLFSMPTLILANELTSWQEVKLSGNIAVHSSSPINISRFCKLFDVLIYAPGIVIEEGFTGRAQFFATDSILINENSYLGYPSILCIQPENTSSGFIKIKEGCSLNGSLLLYQNQSGGDPELTIHSGTKVNGSIYCEGRSELHGEIKAGVYSESLFLKTGAGVYSNYIENCTLQSLDRTTEFVLPAAYQSEKQWSLIKWLE